MGVWVGIEGGVDRVNGCVGWSEGGVGRVNGYVGGD